MSVVCYIVKVINKRNMTVSMSVVCYIGKVINKRNMTVSIFLLKYEVNDANISVDMYGIQTEKIWYWLPRQHFETWRMWELVQQVKWETKPAVYLYDPRSMYVCVLYYM